MTITILEILAAWLKEHGYDGLCDPGVCGCGIKDGLCRCDEPKIHCEAAYRVPADEEFKQDQGYDAEWMYCTEKPVGRAIWKLFWRWVWARTGYRIFRRKP